MAKIKYILIVSIVGMTSFLCSCTKYNYIDGGKANGIHNCTMWEYFHTNSYDWDSLIIMIEKAGMRSVFDGTGEYEQITFFGLTNLSIERHIQNHNEHLDESSVQYWHGVKDIPVSVCQDIISKLVVPRRFLMNEVPRGNRSLKAVDGISTWQETGGMECICLKGKLFVWTQREPWNEVQETGPFTLWIASRNQKGTDSERIASTNIQTTNGVVHALNYNFRFINF